MKRGPQSSSYFKYAPSHLHSLRPLHAASDGVGAVAGPAGPATGNKTSAT